MAVSVDPKDVNKLAWLSWFESDLTDGAPPAHEPGLSLEWCYREGLIEHTKPGKATLTAKGRAELASLRLKTPLR